MIELSTTTKPVGEENYTYYNPPDASDTFTSEDSNDSHTLKILGISRLDTYTSNATKHTDVKNLYTTNCLYLPETEENYTEFKNNIVVKGDFEEKIYQYLPISNWKLKYYPTSGNNGYFQNEEDGTEEIYSLHSIGNLPSPDGNKVCIMKEDGTYVDDSIPTSWNFTDYEGFSYPESENNVSDISDKFTNFYINNVTLNPSTTSDIKTQFTQVVNNDYIGSNVTILKTKSNQIDTPIVNDLIDLIRNIEYQEPSNGQTYSTLIFYIKPNRGNLFVSNRYKSNTDILIDLTSKKEFNDILENIELGDIEIQIKQDAVVLNGAWTHSSGPKLDLNDDEDITSITIKYIKKINATSYEERNIKFVKTPQEGTNEKQLVNLTNNIIKLYLVNGTVENNTLIPLLDIFEKTEGEQPKYLMKNIPRLVVNAEETKEGQVNLTPKFNLFGIAINTRYNQLYITNMVGQGYVNIVSGGKIPEWFMERFIRGPRTLKQYENTETNMIYENIWEFVHSSTFYSITTFNGIPQNELNININSENIPFIGILDDSNKLSIIGSETEYVDITKSPYSNVLNRNDFHINGIYIDKGSPTSISTISLTGPNGKEYGATKLYIKSGYTNPVNDQFVSMIKNLAYYRDSDLNILSLEIKPHKKENLLIENRKEDNTLDF